MRSELVHAWITTLISSGILMTLAGYFLFRPRKKHATPSVENVPRTVRKSDDDLSPATDDLCIVEQEGELTEYQCGHQYASLFAINAYGYIMRPTQGYWDERERCGDCEIKMFEQKTRRCGRCGHVIMPGNGVATYDVHSSFEQKPGVEIIDHQDGSRSAMGCLRMRCCPSGGFYSGHWTGTKFEPAFPDNSSSIMALQPNGDAVVIH